MPHKGWFSLPSSAPSCGEGAFAASAGLQMLLLLPHAGGFAAPVRRGPHSARAVGVELALSSVVLTLSCHRLCGARGLRACKGEREAALQARARLASSFPPHLRTDLKALVS